MKPGNKRFTSELFVSQIDLYLFVIKNDRTNFRKDIFQKAEDKQRKIEDESRGIKTDLHKEEQYIDATAETEEWKP